MEQSKQSGFSCKALTTILILSIPLFLSACGGGGGSSSNSNSTYSGTVTGFGSVFVNGIEFETSGTSISVDDSSATEDDLKVGMQVTVVGNGTSRTAASITYKDELEGIVISNSIAAGQATGDLDIMGQTVTVSATTVVEGVASPDLITAGMIVEVSGHSSGTGSILATRLEVKAADLMTYLATHPEGIEVKGIIANHDEMNSKFDVGGMTVDYSAATLDGMPVGNFDSLYVEVKSTAGIDSVSNELVASVVELESNGDMGEDGKDNDEIEITGLITTSINADSFAIDGETLTVNDETEYEGITKAGLLAGAMVKVDGYYLNGKLIVEEVSVEKESSNEVEDIVASVTSTATNTGTVTLQNGDVIKITSETIMEDSRDNGMVPDPKFNLQALAQGNYVEIKYYIDNGTYIATKVERDDI